MKRLRLTALCATALMALAASTLQAQDAPKPAGDAAAGGGNNNRQRGNPEEFRQRMEERMKTALKASDDEWKVLQPLIEKVTDAQRQSFGGGRFGRGPGGGGGAPGTAPAGGTAPASGATGGNQTNRGGSPESQALRDALEADGTSPETIKAKLTAVREARKKAQGDLATAREELRKVLTVRQEAVLVSMSILD